MEKFPTTNPWKEEELELRGGTRRPLNEENKKSSLAPESGKKARKKNSEYRLLGEKKGSGVREKAGKESGEGKNSHLGRA